MRITRVTAHAFGPFTDETLRLAPGMTVITGPNEAGKSAWHAAIYAALCGIRRGRGRRTRYDENFANRHAPWTGETWEVSCEIALPDDRRVELRHDLSGRIDCSARDLVLGTDVSSEIIHDGAPDGARWLGLDRRTFQTVACVRQSEITAVTDHADALQEHLQRAAATAGTDQTAAKALEVLSEFRRDAVGARRSNSTRPLQVAFKRLDAARERHARASTEREAWLAEQEQVSQLERVAACAERELHTAEVELQQRRVQRLHERLATARALSQRHPHEPPALTDDDELAERVAKALERWERRPTIVTLTGPTADELQHQLDQLPDTPEGDVEPSPEVVAAERRFDRATSEVNAHRQVRPELPAPVDSRGVSVVELNEIARELEIPASTVDARLLVEVERLRGEHATLTSSRELRPRPLGVAVAAGLAIVGAVLLTSDLAFVGIVALVGALAAGLASVGLGRFWGSHTDDSELRTIEAQLAAAQETARATAVRRDAATQRATEHGLPADPAALRAMADAAADYGRSFATTESWRSTEATLHDTVETARVDLLHALRSRGVKVDDTAVGAALDAAAEAYRQQCRQRREQTSRSARRRDLEIAVEERRRTESQHNADRERIESAEHDLRELVSVVSPHSSPDTGPDQLAAMLLRWQTLRRSRRSAAQIARDEWVQLIAVLDGCSIDDLDAEHRAAAGRLEELVRSIDNADPSMIDLGEDPEATVRTLRSTAAEQRNDAASAAATLQARAEQLLSVPEASEALAAAEAQVERVERLDETLALTSRFLAEAQDRVHRDIAPVLQGKVRDRLARVTAGRYSDVTVDPKDLNVRVRDPRGHLRDAAFLSHGTSEQVYLLLRVAMAEILTTTGASCPLLLDDVTVQSDPPRTRAVLDVMHEASHDHQVILFSQETEVLAWAEAQLGENDALIRLPGPGDERPAGATHS